MSGSHFSAVSIWASNSFDVDGCSLHQAMPFVLGEPIAVTVLEIDTVLSPMLEFIYTYSEVSYCVRTYFAWG